MEKIASNPVTSVAVMVFSAPTQEKRSGGVQSTGVSQRVRATGRDESQSVPTPEKVFETWDLELPFLRDLSQVVRCTPRDTLVPQGPCHTKNTTVIVIHYGGIKTLRQVL